MSKFGLFVILVIGLMVVAMAVVIWRSGSTTPSTTQTSAETVTCVDYEGNPLSDGPCSIVPAEGRSCQTASDCTATCGFGCVSQSWMTNGQVDCSAEPVYECDCLSTVCQVK